MSDERRGSPSSRGYDRRWARESATFRQQHPLCCCCRANGSVKPSDVTDHIIPHRGDDALFWDARNWQALCYRCHNQIKSRIEQEWEAGRLPQSHLRLDRPLPQWFG